MDESNNLGEEKIRQIFEKYKQSFIEMEHYDRTGEVLWENKINKKEISKI